MRGVSRCALLCVVPLWSCGVVLHDRVAMGTARLTVRNVGAITTLINANTTCGFLAPAVLRAPELSAAVGSPGTITWRTQDCVLDLGSDGVDVSTSCTGRVTRAQGRLTITAHKSVTGILTGDAETPVIPASPDAAEIVLEKVVFESFKVTVSDNENALTMEEGELSATVKPRLATSATSGACGISSPHVAFESVIYGASKLLVHGTTPDLHVDVKASNLRAQNGARDGVENHLAGDITLATRFVVEPGYPGRATTIPVNGEDATLDPDYSPAAFLESWACTPDLLTPVSFTCADLTQRLADGAARLTVKLFGTLASHLNSQEACGFFNHEVLQDAVITGNTGEPGRALMDITNCALSFRTDTRVSTDCLGVDTTLTGNVTATGEKTLDGVLTGNPQTPALPQTDHPAQLDLTLTFDNLSLGITGSDNGITVRRGTLRGRLQPRTARATSSGVCSVTSPISRFSMLAWEDAVLGIKSANGTVDLHVNGSMLSAVNGAWDTEQNTLTGTVTVNGVALTVPSDGLGLDPMYDAARFLGGWECAADLELPVDFSCMP